LGPGVYPVRSTDMGSKPAKMSLCCHASAAAAVGTVVGPVVGAVVGALVGVGVVPLEHAATRITVTHPVITLLQVLAMVLSSPPARANCLTRRSVCLSDQSSYVSTSNDERP
jgi:hypothetical protein